MEALRKQLSEVEGHLQDRDKKYRDLNARFKSSTQEWSDKESDLDSRLAGLQAQNEDLQAKLAAANAQIANALLITPDKRRDMEEKYQKVKDRLADSEKLCQRLQTLSMDFTATTVIPTEHVTARFQVLKEAIRQLCIKHFNITHDPSAVPQPSRIVLSKLTANWQEFLKTENLTCYLFRALIWRYLDEYLFKKGAHIWGRDVGEATAKISERLAAKGQDRHALDWRIHTSQLLQVSGEFDTTMLESLAHNILEATETYASSAKNRSELANALLQVVNLGAELGSIFCRSRFSAMMTDKPGSHSLWGFYADEESMTIKQTQGNEERVDLMVTPTLILSSDMGISVLVKAEVIC